MHGLDFSGQIDSPKVLDSAGEHENYFFLNCDKITKS